TTPIPIFRIKFIFFHTDIILFTHLPPNKHFSIIAEKSSQVNSIKNEILYSGSLKNLAQSFQLYLLS
ncbi:TPA: hypothetical protein ACHVII_001038, partial [Streptococcus suis]